MIPSKTKIYILSFCFLVTFLAAIFFGIAPLLEEIKQDSEGLAFRKAVLNLLQNQLLSLRAFQTSLPEYQKQFSKIDDGFLDGGAPVAFIEFLEEEAAKSNLQIIVSPFFIPADKSDSWLSTGFNLVLGGGFDRCLRFLERLEQSPWLIEVSQVSIERVSEKNISQPKDFERTLQEGEVLFSLAIKGFSGENPSKK